MKSNKTQRDRKNMRERERESERQRDNPIIKHAEEKYSQ